MDEPMIVAWTNKKNGHYDPGLFKYECQSLSSSF